MNGISRILKESRSTRIKRLAKIFSSILEQESEEGHWKGVYKTKLSKEAFNNNNISISMQSDKWKNCNT